MLLGRLADTLRKSNRFPFATEAFARAGLARPLSPSVILAGGAGAGKSVLLTAMAWEIRTRSVCKKPRRVSHQGGQSADTVNDPRFLSLRGGPALTESQGMIPESAIGKAVCL